MNEPAESSRTLGIGMFILAWVVLFALLIVFFNHWLDAQENPNQLAISSGNGEVVLLPNHQHHYIVNGTINSQEVVFLLDTGATDVVIPLSVAKRLKLTPGIKHYATTANGNVAVYSTQLDSIQIGNIHFANVRASINPGMKDDVVLLGMSALRQIEFSQRGDTLILRQ